MQQVGDRDARILLRLLAGSMTMEHPRTGLALMGFGFVVARLGLLLRAIPVAGLLTGLFRPEGMGHDSRQIAT